MLELEKAIPRQFISKDEQTSTSWLNILKAAAMAILLGPKLIQWCKDAEDWEKQLVELRAKDKQIAELEKKVARNEQREAKYERKLAKHEKVWQAGQGEETPNGDYLVADYDVA
jgi:predicted RNase H-like nuclease (RuvC/YqgF family)